MSPWWALLNAKHAAKGERKKREQGPKSEPEVQKPKVGHKGAKKQIIFQNPHLTSSKKHIREGQRRET
jgi:hypothetical protein